MNTLNNLPFNWFDVVLVTVLILGLYRGRKRGMSQEIFTLSQWLVVVVLGAFGYETLGDMIGSVLPLSPLACYVISYITIAILVSVLFVILKARVGSKLVEAETFGRAEYYLGMPAGVIRFACVLLVFMAVLNARFYSTTDIKARLKYQNDNYGSDFFPGLNSLQQDVFEKSFVGPQIQKYASILLIKPTAPNDTKAPVSHVKLREVAMP